MRTQNTMALPKEVSTKPAGAAHIVGVSQGNQSGENNHVPTLMLMD